MKCRAVLMSAILASTAFVAAAGAMPFSQPLITAPEIAAWITPVQYHDRPRYDRPGEYRQQPRYAPRPYDETAPRSSYIPAGQAYRIVRSLGFEPIGRPRLVEEHFVIRAIKTSTGERARVVLNAKTGEVVTTRVARNSPRDFRDLDPRRDDRREVRPAPRDRQPQPQAESPNPGDESLPDDPPISQQTPRDQPRFARPSPREVDPRFTEPRRNDPRLATPRQTDPRFANPPPRRLEPRGDVLRRNDPGQTDPGQDPQIDQSQQDPRIGRDVPGPQGPRATRLPPGN